MDLPVDITEAAIREIEHVKNNKNIPAEYGLRLGIKGGGCGASLMVGFDKPDTYDQMYTIPGSNVPLYIDKRHLMYIIGARLDFYEGSDARGFMFEKNNEN